MCLKRKEDEKIPLLCKMKKTPLSLSNILFAIVLVFLIIPQTRTPIQVAVNKLKILVWSPSIENEKEQRQLEPFIYLVSDLEGKQLSFKIGEGKVTFISYWATWCPPCIAELPSIEKLYHEYGDEMNYLLITNEDPKVVQKFVADKNYNLPIFIAQMIPPQELNSRSIPTNYVIDKTGKIIIKETGAADWNSEKVRGVLDGLLEE